MVNEFQKMINLLNIVDEQHRLEGEDERDYCRSIICEVINMLKKCSANAEGNKNNKQSERDNSSKLTDVGIRSETIKNLGKILDIMSGYKYEVDNGIYDHKKAMIEEIIICFSTLSNGSQR